MPFAPRNSAARRRSEDGRASIKMIVFLCVLSFMLALGTSVAIASDVPTDAAAPVASAAAAPATPAVAAPVEAPAPAPAVVETPAPAAEVAPQAATPAAAAPAAVVSAATAARPTVAASAAAKSVVINKPTAKSIVPQQPAVVTPPTCIGEQTLNAAGTACDEPTCAAGTELNTTTHVCDSVVPDCTGDMHLDVDSNSCVLTVPDCAWNTYLDVTSNTCLPLVFDCGPNGYFDAEHLVCDFTPVVTCNEGMVWDGNSCLPTAPVCAPDQLVNPSTGECVPDAPSCEGLTSYDPATNSCVDIPMLSCDAGFVSNGITCVPLDPTCIEGTHLDAATNSCVADLPACSPGTNRNDAGVCVHDREPDCGRGQHYDYAVADCVADSGDTCTSQDIEFGEGTCGCPPHQQYSPAIGICSDLDPTDCGAEGQFQVDDYTCADYVECDGATQTIDYDTNTCVDNPPTCNEGTHLSDGVCVNDVTCPEGTSRGPLGCVPDTCPEGQVHAVFFGNCEDIRTCDGFVPSGGLFDWCFPNVCSAGYHLESFLFFTFCAPDVPVTTCDPGTHPNDAGTCVADDPTCPDGQTYNAAVGLCMAPATCTESQHIVEGFCVDNAPDCSQNPGTHLNDAGDACVADPPSCDGETQHLNETGDACIDNVPTCGESQHLTEGNTCVDNAPSCEPGFHVDGETNTCVADGNECKPVREGLVRLAEAPTCQPVAECVAPQTLDPTTNLCISTLVECQPGLVLDPLTQTCYAAPITCAADTHLDPTANKCVADPTAVAGADTQAPATAVAGAETGPTAVAAAGTNLPYTGMPLGGVLGLVAAFLLAGSLFLVTGRRRRTVAPEAGE